MEFVFCIPMLSAQNTLKLLIAIISLINLINHQLKCLGLMLCRDSPRWQLTLVICCHFVVKRDRQALTYSSVTSALLSHIQMEYCMFMFTEKLQSQFPDRVASMMSDTGPQVKSLLWGSPLQDRQKDKFKPKRPSHHKMNEMSDVYWYRGVNTARC